MGNLAEFEHYLEHLCEVLSRVDRGTGLKDYCRGLMLPIARKSVEPLAAYSDPLHVAAKHQSLHHFVAKSEWSDSAVMGRARDWVMPTLGLDSGCYWIIEDMGFPKKGKHSVVRRPAVLRPTGQAGQLPSGGQSLARKRARQHSNRVPALPSQRLGG